MRSIFVSAAALSLCACSGHYDHKGPLQHETRVVELDKSEMARVEINLGGGELHIAGGSPKLLEADFSYDNPGMKPVVRYEPSNFRGQLTIEEPNWSRTGSNGEYKWDLRLNNGLPLDIDTHLGAGEARMELGSANLRSLTLNMGVGNLELDLRGDPKHDYDVQIHGGVGNATVQLPGNAGVAATASGGIGNISVKGLERSDGRWINPLHTHAAATVHLDVRGGVGNIDLIAQ